ARRRSFTEGRRLRVLEPSPERVTEACALADTCGGCDWQHISYDAQLELKAGLIAEALGRTGGFRELPAIAVTASPHALGYRLRARFHIDEHGEIGFHEKRSHRVIAVSRCPVAHPELERALSDFRRIASTVPRLLTEFETAELRVSPLTPERALCLLARGEPREARRRASVLLERLEAEFAVAIGGLPANFTQSFPLAEELLLEVSPHGFVQVNWEVNLALVDYVVRGATARGAKRFLDAYAGAGNFTLPLARAGLSGLSIEAQPEGALAAAQSFARYEFSKLEALADDAAHALARLARERASFDLVLLDPPRAGAQPLLEPLLALQPPHIAYCSCDPVTLARDLRTLCQHGYAIEEIRGFDMFPGTHHVETVVWLGRRCE
ncbi:MAG TPA: RsmD family RNA methyltransferase, partial [Polyangiaceae bacterium]|nr:RsmD family RNA methyltransferase [Polyangiaceae bacterium]